MLATTHKVRVICDGEGGCGCSGVDDVDDGDDDGDDGDDDGDGVVGIFSVPVSTAWCSHLYVCVGRWIMVFQPSMSR